MKTRHPKLDGYEGLVVAVDLDSDVVVAAAADPEELMELLGQRGLRNVIVFRVPRAGEPLRVGLG